MKSNPLRNLLACSVSAAALALGATAGYAQSMDPIAVADRTDALVHLSAAQYNAVLRIITQENTALVALAPGRDRAIKGMPIRQAARDQVRALLTPSQQAVYDINPQFKGGGASFDPTMMVQRLDRLVHLNREQIQAALEVFDRQLQGLAALTPEERNGPEVVKVNQAMRVAIRALLTPDQQSVYDVSPQTQGGGATLNVANRTSDLDRTVRLTDAQVLQVAALYQQQVEALAELAPADRGGPAVMHLFQSTKAAVRAVLTPEQQAKFDANPNGLLDLEERSYIASLIKGSAALAARVGPIRRVVPSSLSYNAVDDQLLNGEYRYGAVGESGTVNLTVDWERAPATGVIVITKVFGADGQPISL